VFTKVLPFVHLGQGRGGRFLVREAEPLFDSSQSKIAGRLRGALAPLSNLLPFPLARGRGYRG